MSVPGLRINETDGRDRVHVQCFFNKGYILLLEPTPEVTQVFNVQRSGRKPVQYARVRLLKGQLNTTFGGDNKDSGNISRLKANPRGRGGQAKR